MPLEATKNIWHNGRMIAWEHAQIHVMSHVIHYGSSVFEGLRCYARPWGRHLPPARTHAAPARLGEDLPHAGRLFPGRALLPPWWNWSKPMAWRPATSAPSRFAATARSASTRSRPRSRSTSPTFPGASTSPATVARTSASPVGTAWRPTPCPRSPRPAQTT